MNVFAVIPCYKVSAHICEVIEGIGPEVAAIIVVDDGCPEKSGALVETTCMDSRVRVIYHAINQGVGGAVITGYKAAMEGGADIIVKIDGDGQMDPGLIRNFIEPIMSGEADYTKGNRFFDLEKVRAMPRLRLFGNAVLSLLAKLSTGYWGLFDPTNGYTAIHVDMARHLPLGKISRGYFFETDMLFRLNTLRAVVVDVPMDTHYGSEISNLKVGNVAGEFLLKHAQNFMKRLFYNYYLHDLSLASLELPIGVMLVLGGSIFGVYHWVESAQRGVVTSAGTVMLAVLPILVGLQLVLAFLGHDIGSVPRRPKHKSLRRRA